MANPLPAMTAALCLALSGCASTTAGTAAPSAPLLPPTVSTLPALLLSAPDLGAAFGTTDLAVVGEVSQPWNDAAHFQSPAEAGCLAIAGAAQKGTYLDTGWLALRGQTLREPPTAPAWAHFATQAAVLFRDAATASGFLARQRQSWNSCANRELRYTQQLIPDQMWAIGPITVERNTMTVARRQLSPQHWFCQRALSVQAAVAVDVEACSLDGPTSAAAAIAARISDRIPAA